MTHILPAVTKRKLTQRDNLHSGRTDAIQTPPDALRPLLPYLDKSWRIWEPACGKGNLVRGLHTAGFCNAFGTDIRSELSNPELGAVDFLGSPVFHPFFDAIVTNPPYSGKNKLHFLRRAYELGKPFAFLLPLTALETHDRQQLFRENGVELLFFDKRVDFVTPKSTEEKPGSSWFGTLWICYRLIGQPVAFAEWEKLPPLVEGSRSSGRP